MSEEMTEDEWLEKLSDLIVAKLAARLPTIPEPWRPPYYQPYYPYPQVWSSVHVAGPQGTLWNEANDAR